MYNDFLQTSLNYEASMNNYQAELEDEFDQDENEYDENRAYDEWQDWCAEQNILQAENNIYT